VRGLRFADFKDAMKTVKPSASQHAIDKLKEWNRIYGSTTS